MTKQEALSRIKELEDYIILIMRCVSRCVSKVEREVKNDSK